MIAGALGRLWRDQSGQTAAEYLGVILVIAAMLAVIARADIDVQIRDGVERQVCQVLGDQRQTCDEQAGRDRPPSGSDGSEGTGRGDPRGAEPGAPPEGGPEGDPGAPPEGGPGADPGAPPEGGPGDPPPAPDAGSVELGLIRTGGTPQGSPAPTGPDPEDNPACEEGYAPTDSDGEDEVGQGILNGPSIRCEGGVPVLDLNRDGIDDNEQRDLFCAQAGACPDDTDLNENGIPDRLEPGAFDHITPPFKCGGGEGITDPFFVDRFCTTENRYYRPGQPGVECEEVDDSELSDDVEGKDAIACKPTDDLFEELERVQRETDPQPESLCETQVDDPLLCLGLGFLGGGGAGKADDAPGFLERLLRRLRGTRGRPAQPGTYVRKNESMSDFSRRYQEQQGARPGQAYRVERQDGGRPVDFDAFENGTLIDAKGKLAQFFDASGRPKPFFRGADSALRQARSQVRAAAGRPIEWRFAEPGPARYFQDLFETEGIPINVRHVPLRP